MQSNQAIALTPRVVRKSSGDLGNISRGIRSSLSGMVGYLIVLVLIVLAFIGPMIAPVDPNAQDYDAILQAPNSTFWFGTDNLGRDTTSRLLHGTRISLQVGLTTIALAVVVGVAVGLVAAQFGGWVDMALMRVIDGVMAFPSLMFALALLAVLGPSLQNVILAIAIGNIPKFARLTRGQALSIGSSDYVTAAKALGASQFRIMMQHIWPNSLDPIIVQASLTIGSAIILEAGLSFLGVGVQPPTPTWGAMLKSGYPFLQTAPWLPIVPGAAIFLTVLGFNLLGDTVRDALDPKFKD